MRFLVPASAKAAARIYIERLHALAPAQAERVVDKLPDNIRFLGLIALLWPGARVIVCSRDLRDIAVSSWLNGFALTWSKKWEHIARRFADYQRIVAHWRQTKAIQWLDVRYEDLVGDLEGHARRLIDYVGLEWDAGLPRIPRDQTRGEDAKPVASSPAYLFSVGRPLEELRAEPSTSVQRIRATIGSR